MFYSIHIDLFYIKDSLNNPASECFITNMQWKYLELFSCLSALQNRIVYREVHEFLN